MTERKIRNPNVEIRKRGVARPEVLRGACDIGLSSLRSHRVLSPVLALSPRPYCSWRKPVLDGREERGPDRICPWWSRRLHRRGLFSLIVVALALVISPMAHADEVHTNGTGGGPWSDPESWRKKKVPGPDDEAIISRGDIIVFDRNDDGKVTCKQLSIDPRGGLTFKRGGGKITMVVGGMIECFGTIKMQANDKADDLFELRLQAEKLEQRLLKLQKGGALLVYGRGFKPNVTLSSTVPKPKDPKLPPLDPTGAIDTTDGGVMLDLKHAVIVDIEVRAKTIDNTGARPNERVNVVGCQFQERARLYVIGCDTALVVDNTFDTGKLSIPYPAINLYGSPLAEIRNNKVKGSYSSGISGTAQTDSVVSGNTIEKCSTGIYWYGTNGMIKQSTVRDCSIGVLLTSASGVVEDIVCENCVTGYHHGGATAQLNNFQYKNPPKNNKDATPVLFASGPLTMVNCAFNIKDVKLPAKFEPTVNKDGPPPPQIETMQYLVLGVKGKVPAGVQVHLKTAKPAVALPAGAADLNIRNCPAPLLKGMTPLPRSLEPIILKSWSLDPLGRYVAAPEYAVSLVEPAAKEGVLGRVLKTLTVTPAETWARPLPNELKATVEVTVP